MAGSENRAAISIPEPIEGGAAEDPAEFAALWLGGAELGPAS